MNSLVFSNMLHRPARTVVSVIGIGIGILLIVFTIGLANGSLRERRLAIRTSVPRSCFGRRAVSD